MGLFSKEKKREVSKINLPHLPELPSSNNFNFPELPNFPESPELPAIETNPMPNLPEFPTSESLEQQEIKGALTPPLGFQKSGFSSFKPFSESFESPVYHSTEKSRINEPVFIRLDKFQMAIETFEEIINKVNEIESLIKKTKEIRRQEEEELNVWEKEIETIKSRMNSIDQSVFSKLDLI